MEKIIGSQSNLNFVVYNNLKNVFITRIPRHNHNILLNKVGLKSKIQRHKKKIKINIYFWNAFINVGYSE
jgi:hypothetical protein